MDRDSRSRRTAMEKIPLVDLPLEPRPVTPRTASVRLAILLLLGLLVFVGVVIDNDANIKERWRTARHRVQ